MEKMEGADMANKMDFRFFHPLRVSIRDINYGGHVGNDVYLFYYQEGRLAYLKNLGFSELDIGGKSLILVRAEVDFKAELFHGDEIKIFCRISSFKNTSFVMEYLIEKEEAVTASTGQTVLVAFDYEQRKVSRIPEDFKEKVKAFENLQLKF